MLIRRLALTLAIVTLVAFTLGMAEAAHAGWWPFDRTSDLFWWLR